MTCADAREYLFAFLDGELDAALSIEFQRHIEHCPACARETEIERAIRRSIVDAVGVAETPTPAIHLGCGPDSSDEGRDRSPLLTRRRTLTIGLAAVILLGLWGLYGQFASHPTRAFADHLVADFERFLAEGRPVQTSSSDPDEVASWLREQTRVPLQLASAGAVGWRLTGGRRCVIDGRPAAFAAFERKTDRAPASVVAIVASADELRGMSIIRRGEETHWADTCRGHSVVACRRGGVVYAVVSKLPEEDLLALMPGAQQDRGTGP